MNRQIDRKSTKQVLIDNYWHGLLKVHAAKTGNTIKGLLEEALSEWWDTNKSDE